MTPRAAALTLQGVSRRFGGLAALDQVSLHVEKGESVGLIGPNGAGKTTLFGLILGEAQPNSGQIHYFGERIDRMPVHRRVRLGIARTYQVPRPWYGLDLRQNIEVARMRNELSSLLSPPNAATAEDETSMLARSIGLDPSQLTRLPGELAMGDLRKLELLRALATKPEILLLDEVFAGLSHGEIAIMAKLINAQRNAGMTMMIVSHDLRALEPLVDRVIALAQGQVIAQGHFQQVIKTDAVQGAYLGEDVAGVRETGPSA